jgi:sulfoxide reductase heme-binding subunit YedZ
MRFPKLTPLQIAVHSAAWLLAAWLAWDYFSGNLTVNPIQAAEQRTGRYAIYFLVLSLACTPLNTVFGFRQAISARRALGLYAFLFAAVHFSIFIGVDYAFDFGLILLDVSSKRYILVGLLALLILTPLAATSFKWWMKRLGKNWKRLHRLIYLAGLAAVLHFAWVRKGDVFSLQGDIWLPAALGVMVVLLLALRIPLVRKAAVSFRSRLATVKPKPGGLISESRNIE